MTESVSTPSIWNLLCTGNLELLEQTWLEELDEPGPIEQFLVPLSRLIEDGKQDLAASLAAIRFTLEVAASMSESTAEDMMAME